MEIQTLLLSQTGEPSEIERHLLNEHLAACADCRELKDALSFSDRELRAIYHAVQVPAGFAARTLAALPVSTAKPENTVPHEAGMRVFASSAPSAWNRKAWLAAAAAIALIVGLAIVVGKVGSPAGTASATVAHGSLTDSDGRQIGKLEAGRTYTAKEDTILRVGDHAQLKALEGANFQIELAKSGQTQLKLQSGDMYAAQPEQPGQPDQTDQNPLVISCTTFQTELHAGDFFVGEEPAAEGSRGVVIVFRGHAHVIPLSENGEASLRLDEGEIYVTVGRNSQSHQMKIAIADARAGRVWQDVNALRKEYQTRVLGYQQELKSLKEQLAQTKENQQALELRERCDRVVTYLDAHQRKLETLSQGTSRGVVGPDKNEIPYEQIERGLNGHSDPSTWL